MLAGTALPPPLQAQPTAARLRSADLADDLAILALALRELHPALHRWATPAAVEQGLQALREAWRGDPTLPQAYRALALGLAGLRCGHTWANIFNQPATVKQPLLEAPRQLPLQFSWLGERLVLTHPHEGLARGTEVLAIDGVPAARVLATLLPATRGDGASDAGRLALLSPQGVEAIETFDLLYPLFFPIADTVRLRVRGPDGPERDVRIATVDAATRRAPKTAAPGALTDPAALWPVQWLPDGSAVLSMSTWATYNLRFAEGRGLEAWIDAVVERAVRDRAPRLVIDLRGNIGGLDCGDVLLSHLVDAPLEVRRFTQRLRYRRIPEGLRPHLKTWDRSFADWGDRVEPAEDGRSFRFTAASGRGTRRVEPRGARYRGRVVVLVNGTNQSATFSFADLVQHHRLGTLVGGPTGGNQRGTTGGAFFFLHLPGSGLVVDVPLIAYDAVDTAARDGGVLPDVAVAPTPAGIAAGRDEVLQRALAVS